MEEEIRVNIDQKNILTAQKIASFTLDKRKEDSYETTIKILQSYIKIIKEQPKMDDYLVDIQLNSWQFINSFQKIISNLQQLNKKANKNRICSYTLNSAWKQLQSFLNTKNPQKLNAKEKIVWLLEVQTKLACSVSLMHNLKTKQDITNSPKEVYPQVWNRITIQVPKDKQSLANDTKKMKKMLHVTASAVINQNTYNFYLAKIVSFGLSFSKYMVMSDSAKLRSFRFYRSPTIQIAQSFWNIPERGATKELIKISYKRVGTNRKIYLLPNSQINNKTDIFTQSSNKITVRILYSKQLHIFSQRKSSFCCFSNKKQNQLLDTVILHMHGGGFIALTSRSSQSYTRKWADELNVPIFSVDYRMPPKHPFPDAPNDCLIVYEFLLNHLHKFMNIRPTNIYIAGESAGGNLACSLTGLILKKKLPIPRGLYLAYPSIDLRLTFTLSRIYALTDILLWPSLLLLCLNSYLGNNFQKAQDPLASPILLDEEYVSGVKGDKRFPLNWPKTIVTVGTKDPLLDDSLVLMQRMVQQKIECECILYEGFSHGYLSTTMLIEETKRTIDQSIQHLKKLMQIQSLKE